jgi:hypothetical protein
MYEEPIHPANLWLEQEPLPHADVDEIYRANIRGLVERGAYTLPARSFRGARYVPPGDEPPAEAWEKARHLWDEGD